MQHLTIKVSTDSGGSPQQSLGEDALPFELRVTEERPVTNVAALPAPSAGRPTVDSAWPADLNGTPTTGGAGFSDAASIKPGTTVRGSLLPGEVQVFKVPMTYGQQLVARTNVAPPTARMLAALKASKDSMSVRMGLFSPELRAYDNFSSVALSGYTTDRQAMAYGTPVLAWRNRELPGSPADIAGDVYIAVVASDVSTGGESVSFLLRADVSGDPTGAPTYGEPGAAQPTAPADDETPSSSSTSSAAPVDAGSPATVAAAVQQERQGEDGLPWLPLAVSGIFLLAVVGGVVAWFRTRQPQLRRERP